MNFRHTARRWSLPRRAGAVGLAAGLAWFSASRAQEPTPAIPPHEPAKVPQTPILREEWVPADALDPILARYPRAVSLSRDELFTLLNDARPVDATQPALPQRAVLRWARFDGQLVNGPDGIPGGQIQVTGEIEVTAFTEQWAELTLGLPGVALGTVEWDPAMPSHGHMALRQTTGGPKQARALWIQGRGPHRLRVTFVLPADARDAGRRVDLPRFAGVADFTLHLPAGARVESTGGCQVQPDPERPGGVSARVALPVDGGQASDNESPDGLAWKNVEPPNSDTPAPMLQDCQVDYLIGENTVTGRMDLQLTSPLGRLPSAVDLPLPPQLRVTSVDGPSLRGWNLDANRLRLDLTPSAGGKPAMVTVAYEFPLDRAQGEAIARTKLPLLEINGVHRVTGRLVLQCGRGMEVRRIDPTRGAVGAARPLEHGISDAPDFVAGYELADLPSNEAASPFVLTVEARKVTARYEADVDTLADFQPGSVRIERRLTLHVAEGEVFTAEAILPKDEEVIAVRNASPGGAEPDWRREGERLVLEWKHGLRAETPATVTIQTRADLAAIDNDLAAKYTLRTTPVPGAGRVTGYVALTAASAYRMIVDAEDHLERRDGRATPVRGQMAWFYRDEFQLAVRIERKTAQSDAIFTGYALPLAGALEIHGQFAYHLSGVEAIKLRVPREIAEAMTFTGPHIAERRLEGDVWTIRFQAEQTGDYHLGIETTLPFRTQTTGTERFHVVLPSIQPLEAARWSGAWAVEANTDTEIRFTVAGASEADALHAPPLAGYVPRQRVIGVYEFIGGGSGPVIALDGVRHPAASSVAAVVDNLELETFVSTSGAQRYRAALSARTAADQFFNLRLPAGSTLWSLTLDGELIKPVGGPAGELRIELPGGRAPAAASKIEVVYEKMAATWDTSGKTALMAPQFDRGVPVLKSRWKLHLPDGFKYVNLPPKGQGSNASPVPLIFRLPTVGLHLLSAWASPFGRTQYKAALAEPPVELDLADKLGDPDVRELNVAPSATPPAMSAATPPGIDSAHSEQPFAFDLKRSVNAPSLNGLTVLAGKKDLPSTRAGASAPNDADAGVSQRQREVKVSGLLPIRLKMPENGREYEISNDGGPGEIAFHYTDRRAAAQRRWIWLTLGILAFLVLAAAWERPWRRWLIGVVALSFFPLVVAPSRMETCDLLLTGWLLATLGWVATRWLLRRRPLPRRMVGTAVALAVFAVTPTAARAAGEPVAPSPTPVTAIVPYDTSKPAGAQQPARYYLPYERFLELWDAAKAKRHPDASALPGGENFVLSAARYEGRIAGETLEIEGVIDLQTFGEGWVRVPLDFAGAEVGAVALDGAQAGLSGDGGLWIGVAGAHRAEVKLRVPAPKFASGSRLAWNIPPSAATLLNLTYARPELRAELGATQGGLISEIVPGGRRLTASIGGADRVEVRFTEETARAATGSGQPASAHIASRVVVRPGREEVHAEVDYSFPGGSLDRFAVSFDPTLTLVDLDAPDVKSWRLDQTGDSATLKVILIAPAKDAYRLSLTADRPDNALPEQNRNYPMFSAHAGRVEQSAALLSAEGLEISLPGTFPAGFRRVESKPAGTGSERLAAAFETSGAPGAGQELTYGVAAAASRLTAKIDYLYQIGQSGIEMAASVRISPPAGGSPVAAASLRLPPDFDVQAVVGGKDLRQWWRDGDLLSLRFQAGDPSAGVAKPVELLVYLVRRSDPSATSFVLRPISVQDAVRTEGEAVIAADQRYVLGLAVSPGRASREAEEIDAQSAAGEFQVRAPLARQRAFRYRDGSFEATVTLALQPVRWEASWVGHSIVHDGFVAVEWHVNAAIRQGELDAWEFTLPASTPEARVSGAEIRESMALPPEADGRRRYRVILQNPVYGGREVDFTINVELPLASGGRTTVPELAFPEAGGEGRRISGGFLLIENLSDGEMTLDAHGLDPATLPELPFKPAQTVAGARCFRAAPGVPWNLEIQLAGLEKTAGRNALVAYVELTSTLRASGEEWHRAVYRLQNRQLQFLPVALPKGVEFIGAQVAGESVQVDLGEGSGGASSLLVPLLKTRPGEVSYDVELIYHRPAPANPPATFANRDLESPRLIGIPVEKTLWNVWLPAGERLVRSGGNVEPVLATLNETEKLESTLSDLRSLSATYASTRATSEERRRALSNFNLLADAVTRSGDDVMSRNRTVDAPITHANAPSEANVRGKDALRQQASVEQRQQAIRRELGVLSTQNSTVQSELQPEKASGAAGWMDQRGSAAGALLPNGIAGQTTESARRGAVSKSERDQLALNDELSVQLPSAEKEKQESAALRKPGSSSSSESGGERHLNTARSVTPLEQTESFSGNIRWDALPAATPPVAAKPTTAPTGQISSSPSRTDVDAPAKETLHSTGRVSLSIDFPQEGQVYHFKKVKDEASLTLSTVQPADFARLGWLVILLLLLAAIWVVRRAWARRAIIPHRIIREPSPTTA